ncbi:GTP cyclohydrolase [Maribacter sp. TH_r10]|uniref:GTP cyclohydrolase n=1 Tax=Maribacter luteus TaxID=2594478 RepID=A0A6I2MQ27_9FLAO|nr:MULTISPECIES: GTP cyclohydrolase [Maribacter]MDV7140494.1 GTP cyclohydrolase [Maribacter sp. TH_r10]MRX64635.1 GTP cyclohydrolase [Maribacter luteus]|tara:strand:- start:1953 stop:3071 length:1119 start_codon:yes stop_codon:yes gene_type:complete
MVTLKEATTKTDLKKFVKFPFSIYKDSPYWIPPIINDELESFDKTKNPAFKNAEARFFLAYKNNEIVGRIAAIINWIEINDQKVKKMRFGWFDFVNDTEVSETLLKKVEEIGKEHQLEYMEGPVGFSNLDKVGVLVEGFDEMGTMITWYNHAYYPEHYERLGFVKEKEYVENRFPFSNAHPKFYDKAGELVKRRYGVKALSYTKTKDVMAMADTMFDLFNETYSSLSSFVPITEIQKAYFKKKYISFINPEYIKFILDKEDNLIAFGIVMPSFSHALQKAKGKLFPFGLFHMLHAKKHSKDVIFYLIGVHPDYQNKGVTAVMFQEYYKTFTAKKIVNCIRTPELADNIAIKQLWKHFNPEIYKRRRTYRKNL